MSEINITTKFKGIQWTANPNSEMPIKMPLGDGPGTEIPITLGEALLKQHQRWPNEVCMQTILKSPLGKESEDGQVSGGSITLPSSSASV